MFLLSILTQVLLYNHCISKRALSIKLIIKHPVTYDLYTK